MAIPNPLAYYKLDSNSNDSVGSNNGTDTAMAYSGAGIIGNAGTFNATSSRIALSPVSSLTTNFTISCWASRAANSAFRFIYTSGTNLNHWRFGIDNTNKVIFTEDNIADYNFGTAALTNTSQLYHIVLVKSGNGASNLTLYLDNVSQGTASVGSVATPTGTAYIGTLAASNYWNDRIDELYITDSALTSGQVGELYNGGAGAPYPFSAGASPTPLLSLMGVGS